MTSTVDSQILACNKLSMEWLRKGNIIKSEEYLLKAQIFLYSRIQSKLKYHLWAITFNNLACIYKRKGNFNLALKYLDSALENEENSTKNELNLAGIHLNISAILSALKDHEKALKHAILAKNLLQKKPVKTQEAWVSLILCYHSIGLELEKLSQPQKASKVYLKAWGSAQEHLGSFHSITELIKASYSNLSKFSQRPLHRSKTPILISRQNIITEKHRNKSSASKSPQKFLKLQHNRFKSLKNLNTLDLIVKELEINSINHDYVHSKPQDLE